MFDPRQFVCNICLHENVLVLSSGMVDPQSGRASGPNKAQFASHLGVLARTKVSILVPDWDHVTEAEKDLIWQDLCVSNSFKV